MCFFIASETRKRYTKLSTSSKNTIATAAAEFMILSLRYQLVSMVDVSSMFANEHTTGSPTKSQTVA
jgi:hypothetical protein